MPIYSRKSYSEEFKKNIRIVKMMTRGMAFDENMSKVNWKAVRLISNIGYTFMPKEKGIKFYRIQMSHVNAEICVPYDLKEGVIIIYIHGGGFVSGSAGSSRGYASMLSKCSGYKTITVDYRLAPENKFPYGLKDCYVAYRNISKRYPDSKIVLVGESAGANLSIGVALKAGEAGYNNINAVILHSPFIDFSGSIKRDKSLIDDFTVKEGCLKALKNIYVGNASVKNKYVSPIYATYEGFPATYITCDENETLYADSMILYEKLISFNVNTILLKYRGTFHAFATIGNGSPETKQILEDNVRFINDNL